MSAPQNRALAEITIVGPDRKGVVAEVTRFVFQRAGNIEMIQQNVVRGLFGMHLEASFAAGKIGNSFEQDLQALCRKFGMEVRAHCEKPGRQRRLAILVSREPHCLQALVAAAQKNNLQAQIACVLGSEETLRGFAEKAGLPFFYVEHSSQEAAEKSLLELLARFDVDFLALARYMRILSPNFVWRYPNRIINIHPSLLPAFSGAYAYAQAHERGAQIVGCTAHFVTEDLDQGPIIWQEAFRLRAGETLAQIKMRGQKLESTTLLKAVQLYAERKISVDWGKVTFLKNLKEKKK